MRIILCTLIGSGRNGKIDPGASANRKNFLPRVSIVTTETLLPSHNVRGCAVVSFSSSDAASAAPSPAQNEFVNSSNILVQRPVQPALPRSNSGSQYRNRSAKNFTTGFANAVRACNRAMPEGLQQMGPESYNLSQRWNPQADIRRRRNRCANEKQQRRLPRG